MKRSYPNLCETNHVTHDNEGTQEIPHPISNSVPLQNNSMLQKNIGATAPDQNLNVLTSPKFHQSEFICPAPETHFINGFDSSIPYSVTLVQPITGNILMPSVRSMRGLYDMKHYGLNMNSRFNQNMTNLPLNMTPLCNRHAYNAPQVNQIIMPKSFLDAQTQTVETTATQTEEDVGMPKRKRGRKRQK